LDASQGKDKKRGYEFINKEFANSDVKQGIWCYGECEVLSGETAAGNERRDIDV